MDEGGVAYQRVRSNLRDIAEQYFTYLTNDESLPSQDRKNLVIQGVHSFSQLARIYKDTTTLEYLAGLDFGDEPTERESLSLQRQQLVQQPVPVRKHRPSIKRKSVSNTQQKTGQPRQQSQSRINLPEGFRTLDDVSKLLKLDNALLNYVKEQTDFEVQTINTNGSAIQGVTDNTYQTIRRYVKRLRS